MSDKKIFDLTAHLDLRKGNGNTDECALVTQRQKEITRLEKETKRVEGLSEKAYDLYALLHAQGYSESAEKARRIWADLDQEHSYLSEQWGALVRTQMGWAG